MFRINRVALLELLQHPSQCCNWPMHVYALPAQYRQVAAFFADVIGQYAVFYLVQFAPQFIGGVGHGSGELFDDGFQ